jgi:hypothetical protein
MELHVVCDVVRRHTPVGGTLQESLGTARVPLRRDANMFNNTVMAVPATSACIACETQQRMHAAERCPN